MVTVENQTAFGGEHPLFIQRVYKSGVDITLVNQQGPGNIHRHCLFVDVRGAQSAGLSSRSCGRGCHCRAEAGESRAPRLSY